MNRSRRKFQLFWSGTLANAPITLLIAFAALVLSSYLLAGWLMRPIADDYGALLAFHTGGLHWLTSFPRIVLTGGGRYAQTIVTDPLYGLLGLHALMLTVFLSTGLFLLAGGLVFLLVQRTLATTFAFEKRAAAVFALILFFVYTTLSVTFPWINGHIDNSFQGFLWLPGFVTYTLPVELLVILVVLNLLYRPKKLWLAVSCVSALLIGTFDEIVPLIFTELVLLIAAYTLLRHGFKATSRLCKNNAAIPLIAFCLLLGLLLNYFSPATDQRQALLAEHTTLFQLVNHSVRATRYYLRTYIVHSGMRAYSAYMFAVLAGATLTLSYLSKVRLSVTPKHLKTVGLFCGLFLVMTIASLFTSFFAIFKGYGITHSYIEPRFEIVYNLWFCLLLMGIGVLLALFLKLYLTRTKKYIWMIPTVYAILTLLLLLDAPIVLHQAAGRLQTVAVFSSQWQSQDTVLRTDATSHAQTVYVPTIDIGDTYNVKCHDTAVVNWLGVVKQLYYHIPVICETTDK